MTAIIRAYWPMWLLAYVATILCSYEPHGLKTQELADFPAELPVAAMLFLQHCYQFALAWPQALYCHCLPQQSYVPKSRV